MDTLLSTGGTLSLIPRAAHRGFKLTSAILASKLHIWKRDILDLDRTNTSRGELTYDWCIALGARLARVASNLEAHTKGTLAFDCLAASVYILQGTTRTALPLHLSGPAQTDSWRTLCRMATESAGARISRLVGSAKAAAVKLKLTEKSDTATAILLDGTDEETTEVLLGLLAGAAFALAPKTLQRQIACLSTCCWYNSHLSGAGAC